LMMGIFVYAFFKFAWAFRLTHYTAIMIGATPLSESPDRVAAYHHADLAAEINGLAAKHSNNGLRSFYYAAAALAWFFGPVPFLVATALIVGILVRRDFYSQARAILAELPVVKS
jgi:uncharacterized membrane protein